MTAEPWIEFGTGWAKVHFRREVTKQDRANLAAALSISTIPADINWLIGKGKTRPDEPLYGVQLLQDLKVVAQAESDDLSAAIKDAVAEAASQAEGK